MTIKEINNFCKGSFIGLLEIEFINYGEDFIEARMPIDTSKHQPMGLLHGGVSLAMAETAASAGSFLLIDEEKFNVFGLQVTGNHIATMSHGSLLARAEIVHKGQSTHIWDVKISSDEGKLISVARVTNIIIEKKKEG